MTFSTLAHEKKRRSEAFRLGLLVEIVDGAAQSQRVTMFHLHLDCFTETVSASRLMGYRE